MGETIITTANAMTRKKWSVALAHYMTKFLFFSRFMGEKEGSIILVKTDLKKQAGDKIQMDIVNPITGETAEGDTPIENDSRYEVELDFGSDTVQIDYHRKSVKKKGRMTDQRVPYKLRNEAKSALSVYFGEYTDEVLMIYLSGARGVNSDFHTATTFTGRASNSIQAPDSSHIFYGGGHAKATLATTDLMSRDEIEKMAPRARLLDPQVKPYKMGSEGKGKFIFLMSEEQAFDLRTGTSDGDWTDIAKRNDASKIYDGSLGEINNCILHAHSNVIKFSDYGSGGTGVAARALLLGANAAVAAWGKAGDLSRFDWNEETYDRGNGLAITAGQTWGCKKVRYLDSVDGATTNGDFGIIALDTSYTALVS